MRIDHSQTLANIELCAPKQPVTLVAKLHHWFASFVLRLQIYNERKELAKLPDHLLRDVGISANEARIESARSFNDVPYFRSRP